jgi:hypothetical protein
MIQALANRTFPISALLTFHPQRWTDKPVLWVKELAAQNMKNVIKRVIVGRKEKGTGKKEQIFDLGSERFVD